mmetsp:Transcript_835/g.3464  ORF Transcript_835/g.3464 Transcript_835/m.3464 type:complete len:351 (+) Transcript_835:1628-2680(+)
MTPLPSKNAASAGRSSAGRRSTARWYLTQISSNAGATSLCAATAGDFEPRTSHAPRSISTNSPNGDSSTPGFSAPSRAPSPTRCNAASAVSTVCHRTGSPPPPSRDSARANAPRTAPSARWGARRAMALNSTASSCRIATASASHSLVDLSSPSPKSTPTADSSGKDDRRTTASSDARSVPSATAALDAGINFTACASLSLLTYAVARGKIAIVVDSRREPSADTAVGIRSSTILAAASHASLGGGGACGSFASAPAADAASARRHDRSSPPTAAASAAALPSPSAASSSSSSPPPPAALAAAPSAMYAFRATRDTFTRSNRAINPTLAPWSIPLCASATRKSHPEPRNP